MASKSKVLAGPTAAQGEAEPIFAAAGEPAEVVLAGLGSSARGLSASVVKDLQLSFGLNVVRSHRASGLRVLVRQFASPFLILLAATAGVSLSLGDFSNSVVIGVILLVSVGLGFANEYRAEKASQALHDRVRHNAVVLRDGVPTEVDVTQLVPGDVVQLSVGAVVAADMRVIEASGLTVDESILTGESVAVPKSVEPVLGQVALGDLSSALLMGTILVSGSATAVVVATGGRAVFGRIALQLGEAQPQTEFQLGLKRFSLLLLWVAVSLTVLILGVNLILQRPLIESIMFSLAIAVGITPQLLPAVVSTSLATGARQLAKRRVLVKSLVSIEDLGNLDVLITDKTGTLTDGRLSFLKAISVSKNHTDASLLTLGLSAIDAPYDQARGSLVGLSQLDAALWGSDMGVEASKDLVGFEQVATLPFDHERRMVSVLAKTSTAALLVSKGSAEDVLAKCVGDTTAAQALLVEQYAKGLRVVAVAVREVHDREIESLQPLKSADEAGLTLVGFLVFSDPVKAAAATSIKALAELGVEVKIATGDNAVVAETVCDALGLTAGTTLTGVEVAAMTDAELGVAAAEARIFARVSPEQKARIVRLLRAAHRTVGFLGDGVNDALALHGADVGISVDTATDVAKDAANVVLLDKDLAVLADGVREGRRIFANTMKYVLMGTSSNFGNMFSAAAASAVLPFLPMLPGQILLNNLLYDTGQLAIPRDRVDPEQLAKPSHWNIAFIRRFMFMFGPVSSLFDFATFALMLFVLGAGEGEFRAGWFVESLATQTLIVFVIRTRRVPFYKSRPSLGMMIAVFGVVLVGAYLPISPLASPLDFAPLPPVFFGALAIMTLLYLVLVEFAKHVFFKREQTRLDHGKPGRLHTTRAAVGRDPIHRRAARFSSSAGGRGSGRSQVGRKRAVGRGSSSLK
jgi:Mg2+-importing ATPase